MKWIRYIVAMLIAWSVLGCENERKLKELRDARTEWGKKKKARIKYYEEQGMTPDEARGRFQLEDSFDAVDIQKREEADRNVIEGDELKRALE